MKTIKIGNTNAQKETRQKPDCTPKIHSAERRRKVLRVENAKSIRIRETLHPEDAFRLAVGTDIDSAEL